MKLAPINLVNILCNATTFKTIACSGILALTAAFLID